VIKVNWFKKHLNLTWLFVALLTPWFGLIIVAKFLAIDIPLTLLNSFFAVTIGEITRAIIDPTMIIFKFVTYPFMAFASFIGLIGERQYANAISLVFLKEGANAAYFFIWFMLPINAWILNQKGRSLHWLWLAFFFVPYISLILGNKKQASHKQQILSHPDSKGGKNEQAEKREANETKNDTKTTKV
jgi:hypothetical protein